MRNIYRLVICCMTIVLCMAMAGMPCYANTKSVTSLVDNTLEAPSINKIIPSATSIRVVWNTVSNVDGYKVQISEDETFPKKNRRTVTIRGEARESCAIKNLTQGTTYYCRICVYTMSGEQTVRSQWSDIKSMATLRSASDPGMLTIIDDDGQRSFLTKMLPIIQKYHVSISSALPVYKIETGSARHMNWDEIAGCAQAGAEILCHTYMHYSHDEMKGMTKAQIKKEYTKAQKIMRQHGYTEGSRILVYSGSTVRLKKAKQAASECFRFAISNCNNAANYKDTANRYDLKRFHINRDYQCDLNSLQQIIDDTYNNGGWAIWLIHSNEKTVNSERVANIEAAVRYAQQVGLPIVSASVGYSVFTEKR